MYEIIFLRKKKTPKFVVLQSWKNLQSLDVSILNRLKIMSFFVNAKYIRKYNAI